MTKIVPMAELASYIDKEMPPSDWLKIEQERISQFADATLDHQFIHLDAERAAQTPFGATIAHGFLSLSLLSYLLEQSGVAPDGVAMVINYGLDKVRFLQPVTVDSRVRAHAVLRDITDKGNGRLLLKSAVTVEIEGMEKPALIAEMLFMYVMSQ